MKNIFSISVILTLAFTGRAWAEAIEGVWKRPKGILVKAAPCNCTYRATAASGDTLSISGCILGGLFCKSESWTRQ